MVKNGFCLPLEETRDKRCLMRKVAYYPGSFDPLTNGHLDMLKQATSLADELVVGIGIHPGKVPMFSFEERAAMVRQVTDGF